MIINILFKKWQKVCKKGLTNNPFYGIIVIENKKRGRYYERNLLLFGRRWKEI